METGPEDRFGTLFHLRGLEGTWSLRAIWAGEGWPADVSRTLDDLPPGPLPRNLVITARALSPGAIEVLAARDANWADERGRARIRDQGLLIIRDAAPESPVKPSFSWSPSAIAVAEALLSRDWHEGVSTGDVARLVDWSPPQVSQVLQAFDENGWTVKYGPQRGPRARRELSNGEGLLQAWASELAGLDQDARLTHRTLRSPLDFLTGELAPILNEEVRWAVSGWAAADELAPMAAAVPSLQIYVHEDDFGAALDRGIEAAGLSDVAEGGRVAFLPAHPSVLALAQTRDGLTLASSPRVYADLLSIGGRAVDAAEHLKEEALARPPAAQAETAPPRGLTDWEQRCRERLHDLATRQVGSDPYRQGSWSASYRLLGAPTSYGLSALTGLMREVVGRETGWPAWQAPAGGEGRPRRVDGELECWLREMLPSQPSHADYWRADPQGRFCLVRLYEEASELNVPPHTALDLVLPIWRTGECLLHAKRMAQRLDGSEIQAMMRWVGLRDRRLRTLTPGRRIAGAYPSAQDQVVAFLETTPAEIDADLPGLVRRLVEPLYKNFELFEPPAEIFEEELRAMTSDGFGRF
ncbi:MAG TPA: hypothetical protein VFR75_07315 [Solirubrobacterales bacterium]|nr:hypothetical protein [Solirubrobacterales bacterium]